MSKSHYATRAQHLQWSKERAIAYLDDASLTDAEAIGQAHASIASDLEKHPETAGHMGSMLMLMQLLSGDMMVRPQARRFIEGFN